MTHRYKCDSCERTLAAPFFCYEMSPLPAMSTPAPRSKEIKSVCVFCGSGPGADPIYVKEAEGTAYIHICFVMSAAACIATNMHDRFRARQGACPE